MPTPGEGAIGALDWNESERQALAKSSVHWKCNICGKANKDLFDDVFPSEDGTPSETKEESEPVSKPNKTEEVKAAQPVAIKSKRLARRQKQALQTRLGAFDYLMMCVAVVVAAILFKRVFL